MAKVGRPKNIKSPDHLWELFCDYRKQVKDNPIKQVEQSKMPQRLSPTMMATMKPAMIKKFMQQTIDLPLQRPLTIEGFENYCFEAEAIHDLGDYLRNKDGRYSEFATICTYIKHIVRQDQIEGGMAGIYNASITQRLNGLVDKTQSDVNINMPKIEVQDKETAKAIEDLFKTNN
jgi:hypothetical protein